MDISELKAKKKKACRDIEQILFEFSKETGLFVELGSYGERIESLGLIDYCVYTVDFNLSILE